MQTFLTRHMAGAGDFITAVSGSTGDYDLTLRDGSTVEGYDETAGSFSTAAPLPGDLFLYGTGDGKRDLATADQDVIPAALAAQIMRIKDTTLPTLASSVPAHEAVDVAVDANIVLTFSKAMVISDSAGVVLSDTATSTPVAGAVSVSGTDVTINPTGSLTNDEEYQVVIAADALTDKVGNFYAGLEAAALTFTVVSAS